MDKQKWNLLHKHLLWTETWNNTGDRMDQWNDAKLCGEMFYGDKNDLVIYQDFLSNINTLSSQPENIARIKDLLLCSHR